MAIGLDAFGVTFLARELKELLRGQVIRRVTPGEARQINLHLSGGPSGGGSVLSFLAEPGLPLLCVEEHAHREPGELHMPRFEDPLRDCEITDVNQIDLDRVVMITAEKGAGAVRSHGAGERFRLYFELIPPFPNLYLADGQDTILAVLFRAGTRTRRRILERGQGYTPPAAPGKVHPVDVTEPLVEAVAGQGDPEALSKTILGISPFMSREIIARGRKRGSMFKAWTEMFDRYKEYRARASVFAIDPAAGKNPPHLGLAWFRPARRARANTGPSSHSMRPSQP